MTSTTPRMTKANSERGESLLQRDARAVWHPFSHAATEPELISVASAKGAWLQLENGNKILDGISSWWTCLHGHAHPVITDAIHKQSQKLDHVVFAGATHAPAVDLAEKLVNISPRGLSRVFYSDDGSTAVEVALKMAIQYHYLRGEERTRIVALEHGYHGDTFGAMAVGDAPLFSRPFAKHLFSVDRLPAASMSEQTAVPDPGWDTYVAAEKLFKNHGHEIAAMITEPMLQGAGGMRVHSAEFVKNLRELCTRYNILWIADEVLTGFGRTGRMFACEHAGVAPDILCIAKGLTGGVLPLAATLCREEIYQIFQSGERARAFFHGHSFTANPIACAAALASLTLTKDSAFLPRIQQIGARSQEKLGVLKHSKMVKDVRGIGLMSAVELNTTADYISNRALAIRKRAIELGVLLRPLGPVIYILPPACVDDNEVDLLCNALIQIVSEIENAKL